jgi:Na+/H+-translocating membrane pyrophosphatase
VVRNTTEATTERFSTGKAALPSFPLFSVYLEEVETDVAAEFFPVVQVVSMCLRRELGGRGPDQCGREHDEGDYERG